MFLNVIATDMLVHTVFDSDLYRYSNTGNESIV